MGPKNFAVITRALAACGVAYAGRIAAEGYALLLVARRADRLQDLAGRLADTHGVSAETLVADLEDASDLAALAARLETDPVAVLINNAGAGALGPTAIKGADAQESLIRLNIVALTRLSIAALEIGRAHV